jgi:hypothetical protein
MVKETDTVVEQEAETKEKRKAVAEHDLLSADSKPLADGEGEEKAYGISYKLLANGKVFTWNWNDANEDERRMLACFGAKTLATNITSAERTAKSDADGQFDAIGERFHGIRGGVWVDRTREPGQPRVNREALAAAICQFYVGQGKRAQADIGTPGSGGEYDTTLARLNNPKDELLAKARTIPAVMDLYNAAVGKKVATVDDLLA